ncbi:MAG: TRAP transporter small permease subunit [Myxococcota bacterium]|nr:TRAP transporter small permease subunit [Myxococcota bacterium]
MIRQLVRLSSLVDRLTGGLGGMLRWLTLAMVLVAAANAVLRYAGRFVGANLTSNASIETQWYLFSVLFLLGASVAVRQDAHVRVDVLYGQLSTRGRAVVDLFGGLLLLIPFCWFAFWVCSPSVRASVAVWEVSPDPGGLPRWPIKCLMLACFGLLMAQGASEVVKRLALLRGVPVPHWTPPGPAEEAP